MPLLVTGSIGIDTVRSPFGQANDCLGGSVTYFSLAASFFNRVRFMGVVGEDCPFDLKAFFAPYNVDMEGLEIRQGSKTFRWAGTYQENMNIRNTDSVELNVLAEAPPRMPQQYKDSRIAFLANTNPALQLQLLDELTAPRLVVADTMDLWINIAQDDLRKLISRIQGFVLNEQEATLLTGKTNLVTAAKEIVKMGPEFVVIKKGEHGTLLVTRDDKRFALPAYPTEKVVDPTGAGDTFAGGMMGYLASQDHFDWDSLKKAIAYGTCAASLVIEDFSLNRWKNVGKAAIDARLAELKTMMQF